VNQGFTEMWSGIHIVFSVYRRVLPYRNSYQMVLEVKLPSSFFQKQPEPPELLEFYLKTVFGTDF
jgi:hypothetical protein